MPLQFQFSCCNVHFAATIFVGGGALQHMANGGDWEVEEGVQLKV